jgi:hypothetical protein
MMDNVMGAFTLTLPTLTDIFLVAKICMGILSKVNSTSNRTKCKQPIN